MTTQVHHVLWTGGWDSTFRVLDLVLTHRREVQPWYVLEPIRGTTQRELDTMTRIRLALAARDPAAAALIRPTAVRRVDQIPPDPVHAASAAVVGARAPITTQQHFLPVLARHEGLGAMETGITANDHMEKPLARCLLLRDEGPAPDDWWYLDEAESDPDDFRIWGAYRLPLLHVGKVEMAQIADRGGFRELLEMTWFCRHPTVFGNACGLCVPCDVTRDAGVRWRVPDPTRTRRTLRRVREEGRRRRLMLRADAASVVGRLRRSG